MEFFLSIVIYIYIISYISENKYNNYNIQYEVEHMLKEKNTSYKCVIICYPQ